MKVNEQIRVFLHHPAHLFVTKEKGWYAIVALSALLPLLLIMQQPFGIHCWHQPHKCLILIGFGILFLLIYGLVYAVMPNLYPKYFEPSGWTIQKEINTTLLFFVVLGITYWLYDTVFIGQEAVSTVTFLKFQYYTAVYGIVPKFALRRITVLITKPWWTETATEASHGTSCAGMTEPERAVITLGNDQVPIESILLIHADENNMQVYILLQNICVCRSYRCTLKKLAAAVSSDPRFVRCHKSYVVNIDQVNLTESRKMKNRLRLHHIEQEVPVSRSFSKQFYAKLSRC